MTEFVKQKNLDAATLPTGEQVLKQFAEGMTYFSTVGGGRRVVYGPDQVKPEDIEFLRFIDRTADSFHRLADKVMDQLEKIV